MRNLEFSLSILIFTSFAFFVSCTTSPESNANTAANSSLVGANTVANSEPHNTAANSNGSNTVARTNQYPQPVTDEFVTACEGTGARRENCECVFEKVRQQYTFEEFSEIESKLNAGEPADEFVQFSEKARAECMK